MLNNTDKAANSLFDSTLNDTTWSIGMTSLNEQKYLQWFAQNIYLGEGKIVELGSWLGSLTQALSRGLQANSTVSEKSGLIHVYDLFEWEHNMADTCKTYNLPWSEGYTEGDDFLPLYEELMQDYSTLLTVNKADLCTTGWNLGSIELLIVDSMKYEALCDNITKKFYPSLVENSSYLVHQDFMHFYESWIHVSAYRLREYIEPVFEVPNSGSFVFKCIKTPPESLLGFENSIAEVSDAEIDATYEWALSLLDPRTCNILAASHTMAYIHKRDFSRAQTLYAHYRDQYPAESSLTPEYYQFDHMRDYCARFGLVELNE